MVKTLTNPDGTIQFCDLSVQTGQTNISWLYTLLLYEMSITTHCIIILNSDEMGMDCSAAHQFFSFIVIRALV